MHIFAHCMKLSDVAAFEDQHLPWDRIVTTSDGSHLRGAPQSWTVVIHYTAVELVILNGYAFTAASRRVQSTSKDHIWWTMT